MKPNVLRHGIIIVTASPASDRYGYSSNMPFHEANDLVQRFNAGTRATLYGDGNSPTAGSAVISRPGRALQRRPPAQRDRLHHPGRPHRRSRPRALGLRDARFEAAREVRRLRRAELHQEAAWAA